MIARDTLPDAHDVQVAIYRRLTGEQRVALAMQMSEDAREITRAGIRARHPEYDDEQTWHALVRLLLGDALYCAAWPKHPLVAP